MLPDMDILIGSYQGGDRNKRLLKRPNLQNPRPSPQPHRRPRWSTMMVLRMMKNVAKRSMVMVRTMNAMLLSLCTALVAVIGSLEKSSQARISTSRPGREGGSDWRRCHPVQSIPCWGLNWSRASARFHQGASSWLLAKNAFPQPALRSSPQCSPPWLYLHPLLRLAGGAPKPWEVSSVTPNYYKVLELSKDATAEAIRSSFKKLVLKHHPDKNAGFIFPIVHALAMLCTVLTQISPADRKQERPEPLHRHPGRLPCLAARSVCHFHSHSVCWCQEAYAVLSDKQARAEYDRFRLAKGLTPSRTKPAPPRQPSAKPTWQQKGGTAAGKRFQEPQGMGAVPEMSAWAKQREREAEWEYGGDISAKARRLLR